MNVYTLLNNKNGIALSILLLVNSLMVYYNDLFSSVDPKKTEFINIFVIIMVFLVGISEKINNSMQTKKVLVSYDSTCNDVKDIRASLTRIEDTFIIDKEKNEKKYESARYLAKLINENLISMDTISKHITGKKFISVFCNQESPQIPQDVRKQSGNRKYPSIFTNIGFVRPVGFPYPPYFIAVENNIPEQIRDIDKLANYLKDKGIVAINDEWDLILNISKKVNPDYYNMIKNIKNPYNLSMLLTKSNIADIRHFFVKDDKFDTSFSIELASIIKNDKLKLTRYEKTQVKNFLLESSIDILIEHIPDEDKNKILDLERTFKKSYELGGLSIKYFYEYHKRKKNDIKQILVGSFFDDKAEKYADVIIENSRKYEETLLELEITI